MMSQNDSQTLLQAINGCRRRSEELAVLIERTTIHTETSGVNRLRKILRGIRQENKILELLRCLEAYKSVISLKLLHDLRTMKKDEDAVDARYYHVPSFKVLRFIGRAGSLQFITETLRRPAEYSPRIVVLVGLWVLGRLRLPLSTVDRHAWIENSDISFGSIQLL